MNNEVKDKWRRVNNLLSAMNTFCILTERVGRGATLAPIPAPDFDLIAHAANARLRSGECFLAAPADFLSTTRH